MGSFTEINREEQVKIKTYAEPSMETDWFKTGNRGYVADVA